MKFSINIRKTFLFFLFLSLVSANDFLPGRILYAVFVGLFVFGTLEFLVNKAGVLKNTREKLICCLGFAILLSWGYGVFLGAVSGVPEKYFLINFAGMVFYFLLLYFYIVRPCFDDVARVFFVGFLVQLLIGFSAFYQNIDSIMAGGFGEVESISELRSVYSVGYSVGFPIFTVSIYALLNNKYFPSMYMYGRKSAFTFFLLSSFLVIVPAMSKGFILAAFCLGFLVFFSSISRSLFYLKVPKLMVVFCLGAVVFFSLILYEYFDIIVYSFSGEEVSNAKRSTQAPLIMNEVTFWGAGLGAGLESGYTRATEPYAFELSYLSILHKLGFMALPLFFAYVFCFFRSVVGMFLYGDGLRFAFSLGLMGYSIVGIGNPILLGGLGVLFHTISLYLLSSHRKGF